MNTPVEAPIEIDGAYALQVDVVEKAYAALQARRKEEAEKAAFDAANASVTVVLTRKQATRLSRFLGWDSSVPAAIENYSRIHVNNSTLRADALSGLEMGEIRARILAAGIIA